MYIQVKVIPKSPRTQLVEIMPDETWKIRIAAPPEKGKANEELIKFLAKHFGCKKSEIKIISGQTDQRKLVKVPN